MSNLAQTQKVTKSSYAEIQKRQEVEKVLKQFRRDEEKLKQIRRTIYNRTSILGVSLILLSTAFLVIGKLVFKLEISSVFVFTVAVALIVALESDVVEHFLVARKAGKELECSNLVAMDNLEFIQKARRYGDYVVLKEFELIDEATTFFGTDTVENIDKHYIKVDSNFGPFKEHRFDLTAGQAKRLNERLKNNTNLLIVIEQNAYDNRFKVIEFASA